MVDADVDIRGIRRGSCSSCGCEAYDGGGVGRKCLDCGHPPGKHKNLDLKDEVTGSSDADQSGEKEGSFCVETVSRLKAGKESLDSLDYSERSESPKTIKSEVNISKSLASIPVAPNIIVASLELPNDQICIYPNCTSQKYKDGEKMHHFCGRYHARKFKELVDNTKPPELICKTPGCGELRHMDASGKIFDFCRKSCPSSQLEQECGKCQLPGCEEHRYQDPANCRVHHFCSRSHASQARAKGIPLTEYDSQITLVDLQGKDGLDVVSLFKSKWAEAKGACPAISSIFAVVNSSLRQTWHRYKATLQTNDVQKYFHGTSLGCNIMVNKTLCSDTNCGVCGISNTGFDRRCIRKNIDFQRFGHGFYVAPNSSKCHDYTQGKHGYRAMVLFDVCPGNTYVLQRDDETLTQPPTGYNSVHGRAGQSLNYDELVLYNPDGAFPSYIIVYQRDGEQRIAKNMPSSIKKSKKS